jgi:hypothetical protein
MSLRTLSVLFSIALLLVAPATLDAKGKGRRVADKRGYAWRIGALTEMVHGDINGMTAFVSNQYYDLARGTSGTALSLDRAARGIRFESRKERAAARRKYMKLRYYQAQYSYATAYYLYLGMQASGDSFERIEPTYNATILATEYAEADLDQGF